MYQIGFGKTTSLQLKSFIIGTSLVGLRWNIFSFWLEKSVGRMKALCGEADGDGGNEGESEADEEKEESNRLEVKTPETQKLWELAVELWEEGKVVVLLYVPREPICP